MEKEREVVWRKDHKKKIGGKKGITGHYQVS